MPQKPWHGFRSVLCPIDFSEHSRLALQYAEAIAHRGRATLRILYANDPLLVAAAAAALHDRTIAKRSANELQGFIETTLTADSMRRLGVKSQVATGDPAEEILKFAHRGRADLIVLGTHGLTGADRILMGSTTLSILQRTTLPVLAVPRQGKVPGTVRSPWPGERIVSAIELDSDSAKDVAVAARLARWFGSSLLLCHVVSEISAPAWLEGALSAHERILVAQAQEQIDALAVRARRHVKTDTRIVCGRIADEIAVLAATERVGLAVTALRDRRTWFGARRGSVSYHVLSHAVTPVLACPPEWRPR